MEDLNNIQMVGIVILIIYAVLWLLNIYPTYRAYRKVDEGGCWDPCMKRPGILLCAVIALRLPAIQYSLMKLRYKILPAKLQKWEDLKPADSRKQHFLKR
jgi:hypothetical protein